MAQPDSDPLEDKARQALLKAITEKLHTSGFPVHAIAAVGAPSGDDLKALVASRQAAAQDDRRLKRPVSDMTPVERLVAAFDLARIDDAVRAQILQVFSPQALADTILVTAGFFVASQFTPVGWAEDIALGITAVFVGSALLRAVKHLAQFAGAATATTEAELDTAAEGFAQACADLSIDVLMLLIMKTKGGTAGGSPANAPMSADMVLAERGGQLVVVAADTIPEEVAAGRGFAASGRGGPSAGSGGRPPGGGTKPPGGGGATPPAGPSLRKLAEEAGAAEEIEGEIEVFAHGTSSEAAFEMIESSGGSLSPSGGNFGGQLHTVPDPAVARVFAQRTAGRVPGGAQPSVVGIALPRKIVEMLRQRGLLRSNPIQNPPPGVSAGAQQWVFEPGALEFLQKYGYFFSIH